MSSPYGRGLLGKILGAISDYEHSDGRPLLSSVVRWMVDGFIVSTKGASIDTESSFEEVSALAQTDISGFPREAGESGKASESPEDSEHALRSQSTSKPLQERDIPKSHEAPLIEMDRASFAMPKEPESGDLAPGESTPSSEPVSKPLDQDEERIRESLEREPVAMLEAVFNVSDNQEHTALENMSHTPSSPLPAWAQDPPKKKRAGRKKKTAETPFSLF